MEVIQGIAICQSITLNSSYYQQLASRALALVTLDTIKKNKKSID